MLMKFLGSRLTISISELPEMVELAIIGIPRSEVIHAMRSCIRKGIRAVIIFSQGFANANEEGRVLQEGIVRIARRNVARILGPNTLGVFNASDRFTSIYTSALRVPMLL
jgi:acetyltransferase